MREMLLKVHTDNKWMGCLGENFKIINYTLKEEIFVERKFAVFA